MAEYRLTPRSIFDAVGGCRAEAPGVTFVEAPARALTSLAAARGADPAPAIRDAFGLDLPGPGASTRAEGAMAFFAAPGQWLLHGVTLAEVAAAVGDKGAVTDQSDAFVEMTLDGVRARDVLMRLSSLDFDDAAFPDGAVARTPMQQISVIVARIGDGYVLNTPRSSARGFAHDVAVAVRSMEARRAI